MQVLKLITILMCAVQPPNDIRWVLGAVIFFAAGGGFRRLTCAPSRVPRQQEQGAIYESPLRDKISGYYWVSLIGEEVLHMHLNGGIAR